MKTATILKATVLASACIFFLFSCRKDSSDPAATPGVSEEEAMQAIAQSVTPATGGMVSQSSEASAIATIYTVKPCGVSFDSSIAYASAAGGIFTYSINLNWGWTITCGSPAQFQSYFKGHTTYGGLLMSSDDSSHATMNLTGLGTTAPVYSGSLNYVRNGSQQSKIGNKDSFESVITITSSDITVSKATNEIASGTAPVTITGTSTGGLAFTYHGNLVFNGNRKATLTMSSGVSSIIAW